MLEFPSDSQILRVFLNNERKIPIVNMFKLTCPSSILSEWIKLAREIIKTVLNKSRLSGFVGQCYSALPYKPRQSSNIALQFRAVCHKSLSGLLPVDNWWQLRTSESNFLHLKFFQVPIAYFWLPISYISLPTDFLILTSTSDLPRPSSDFLFLQVIQHSAYSPVLAPSDHALFLSFKKISVALWALFSVRWRIQCSDEGVC